MKYAHILFLQEHQASRAMEMLLQDGTDAVINYLKQFDTGVYHDIGDKPAHGKFDNTVETENYILTWNNKIPYIGLERKLKPTQFSHAS